MSSKLTIGRGRARNCVERNYFGLQERKGGSVNKDVSIYRASIFLSNVILALASPLL